MGFSKKKLLMAGGMFLFALVLFGRGQPASAATLTWPNPSDFTRNDVQMVVANIGPTYLLDAPESRIHIFTQNRSGSVVIKNAGYCDPNDRGGVQTEFILYSTGPQEIGLVKRLDAANASCNSGTLQLNWRGLNPNSKSAVPGHEAYYVLEFAALAKSSNQGWNMFYLQMDDSGGPDFYGRPIQAFSFYAGAPDKFALKEPGNGIPGTKENFRIKFAPTCDVSAASRKNKTISWFDADAGQANQNFENPVVTRFIESPNDSIGTIDPLNIRTGNNVGGSQQVKLHGKHTYTWTWYDIYSANGIQFHIPYDSFNAELPCLPPDNAVCTTANNNLTLALNTSRPVNLNIQNTGGIRWDNAAWQWRQYLPTAGPFNNYPLNKFPVFPNQTRTVTYVIPARGAPANNVVYEVWPTYNGAKLGSSPCRITVNYANTPSGGFVASQTPCTAVNVRLFFRDAAGRPTNASANARITYASKNNAGAVVKTYAPVTFVVTSANNHVVSRNPYVDVAGLSRNGKVTASLEGQGSDGSWSPLPPSFTFGPCIDITPTCQSDATAPEPEEPVTGSTFSAYAKFTNRTSVDTPAGQYTVHVSWDPQINIAAPNPSDFSAVVPKLNSPAASFGFTGNTAFTVTGTGGSITLTVVYVGDPADISPTSKTCKIQIKPASRPYIWVQGDDANAGGEWPYVLPKNCVRSANINTYGRISVPGGGPNGRYGSSTDFAALATGDIFGSVTDGNARVAFYSGNAIGDPAPTTNLNFANVGSFMNSTVFGGHFGANDCLTDYFSDYDNAVKNGTVPVLPPPTGISDTSGIHYYDTNGGTAVINGMTLSEGDVATIYINGDAIIAGDIRYNTTAGLTTNIANWPYFKLVVKGNIYIDQNAVKELNGLYVAQPTTTVNPPDDGVIYDCANANAPVPLATLTADQCFNQLKVNGAFIAQKIAMARTGVDGARKTSTVSETRAGRQFNSSRGVGEPTEIFNLSPELVIGIPNVSGGNNNGCQFCYDNLVSLPPIF